MRMFRFVPALLFVLALGATALPLNAQDGPTEEEIIARLEAATDWEPDNYTAETSRESANTLVINFQGSTLTQTETTSVSMTGRGEKVDEETQNRQIEATVEYSLFGFDGEAVSYTLQAEIRFVDNRLYVRGEYTASSGQVPPLPDGWLELAEDELADWEAFDAFELDDFFEDEDDEEEEEDPLAEFLAMAEAANATFTLEPTTLEDGTEAELITIIFAPESISTAFLSQMTEEDLAEEGAALGMAMFENLTDQSEWVLRLWLTEDNQRIANESFTSLVGAPFDLHELDPTQFPEGMTLDTFEQVDFEQERYLTVNEGVEPIEAPE